MRNGKRKEQIDTKLQLYIVYLVSILTVSLVMPKCQVIRRQNNRFISLIYTAYVQLQKHSSILSICSSMNRIHNINRNEMHLKKELESIKIFPIL